MQDSRIGKLFYLLHDLWRQTRRWQEIISRKKGLTMPQFRALAQLCNADGVSQAELAGMIDSDPMTTSGVVERLETHGLVRREQHPTDSRAKVVFVTEKARTLVDEVRGKALKREAEVFEGVSDADLATTVAVLERISANLAKSTLDSEGAK